MATVRLLFLLLPRFNLIYDLVIFETVLYFDAHLDLIFHSAAVFATLLSRCIFHNRWSRSRSFTQLGEVFLSSLICALDLICLHMSYTRRLNQDLRLVLNQMFFIRLQGSFQLLEKVMCARRHTMCRY